jgi:hypothetical protein
VQLAERQWSGDAQQAARRCLLCAGLALSLLDLRQDLRAARVIGSARFGQVHATGGPVQQPHAEMGFQGLHVVAGHLGGYAEVPRGPCKTAGIHDALEDRHAEKPVHGVTPKRRFGKTEAQRRLS